MDRANLILKRVERRCMDNQLLMNMIKTETVVLSTERNQFEVTEMINEQISISYSVKFPWL